MAILGPVLGGGLDLLGGALGGYFSYKGVKETNVANARMAREQMQFQERMANTAYQRSMADMRSAGLNPILAFSKGGADTPVGARADMQNAVGAGVATALQAMRLREDLQSIRLQNQLTKAAIPEAKARAHFWDSWFGKTMPYIEGGSKAAGALVSPFMPILNSLQGVSSAFNALNFLKR